MKQIIVYLILFLLTIIGLGFFRKYAYHKNLLDNPNQRSSHTIPTPRGGGIVFIGLWLVFLCICALSKAIPLLLFLTFFLSSVVIATISYIDDNYSLKASLRFLFQMLAAILALVCIGPVSSLDFGFFTLTIIWLIMPLLFFAMVWSINLFNFMDGLDGFTTIEALFMLGIGGILIYHQGGQDTAYLIWGLVATLLGFLCWNWPKAKIFMGDVGSTTLGLIIMITGIVAQKYYQVPFILWLMLYGVFLFDATVTLIRRILRKEQLHLAHRNHAYQRLNQAGWSHKQVLFGLFGINTILTFIVLLANKYPALTLYFSILELFILILIYWLIEKRKAM